MAVKIAHARISEKGTIEGIAGDQTGHEVEISDWYSGGWLAVYRPCSQSIADDIAATAAACAENNNIGYSQADRLSLYRQAVQHDFQIGSITEKCNTDCSALVSVCVNSAGVIISKDMTTRNEDIILMGTGKFTRLQSKEYLRESEHLKRGDILRKQGHTAIVVSGGTDPEPVYNRTNIYADYLNRELQGKYRATTDVYMREGGSITYRAMTVIFEDHAVYCYGYYSLDTRGVKWLLCDYADNGIRYTGFVSSNCITRVGDI